MKVKDLIDKLKQFDPDLVVKADYIGNYCDLKEFDIRVEEENGNVFLVLN